VCQKSATPSASITKTLFQPELGRAWTIRLTRLARPATSIQTGMLRPAGDDLYVH
jgi:hypothetical protein